MRQLQGHLVGSARRQDLLKITDRHLSEHCERVGILREDQSGFRPNPSTTDMMFVICRLQKLASNSVACMLYRSYQSVRLIERTLLWTVIARFSVSQNVISVIRQFHDGMRACVRLDDRACSGRFAVEQGLRQGCVLAPLLCSIFFAAAVNVAYTHFKAHKYIMDALVHLRKKTGWGAEGSNQRRASPGDVVLKTDRAGVVSQPTEQPRKMMGVIVVACEAFGLIVLEAKTEIMCLRTKGMPEPTVMFSVEAAGQVYNQTNEFVYLGRSVNHNANLSVEVNRRIRNAWCAASGSTPLNCTTNRSPSSSTNTNAKSRGT